MDAENGKTAFKGWRQYFLYFLRFLGARGEVDPLRHLVGIAALWGGNPEKDAAYLNFTPRRNDGKKSPDASVTIQFGDCDGKIANCLPIVPGWNYTVRLYRPDVG